MEIKINQAQIQDLNGYPLDEQTAREVLSRVPENADRKYNSVIAVEENRKYTWDLALVFDTGQGNNAEFTIPFNHGNYVPSRHRSDLFLPKKKYRVAQKITKIRWCQGEMAVICHLLKMAGLQTFIYKSNAKSDDNDTISSRWYVLVGASESRLLREAARSQFELKVNRNGAIDLGVHLRFPLAIQAKNRDQYKEYFENLYCPFPSFIMNQRNESNNSRVNRHARDQLFQREVDEWIIFLEFDCKKEDGEIRCPEPGDDAFTCAREFEIEKNATIDLVDKKIMVTGRGRGSKSNHIYRFYDCKKKWLSRLHF